jgi:PiT family inorganic phosphate transporter
MLIFVLAIILVALTFEYINGFHDTANAIATSVATKVLTPFQAVAIAATFDLVGALVGTAVAKTIAAGLVDTAYVSLITILCALLAAIVWNLLTWWLGLPSSSSHALIGGLCGAAVASAHGVWSVIRWSVFNPATNKMEGLLPKVILPMFISPLCGTLFGFVFMGLLIFLMRGTRPLVVNAIFGKLQVASAAWMSFGHGMNDAQKTMGIIALVLFTATTNKTFEHLPRWCSFLLNPNFQIHTWVKVTCALVMAAGIATGGWRIIKTMGKKLVRLQPIHGFAAQTTAALVIQVASVWGMPLSTTHVISTSIMGVGATKRLNAVKWRLMGRIVWAWVLTLPVTAVLGYGLFRFFDLFGFR